MDVLPQALAFIPLAGATLCTATGVMTCPPTAAAEGLSFLSPTFTSGWRAHMETDPFFWPIYHCASSTFGAAVDALGRPVTPAATLSKLGAFIIRCWLLFQRGQGKGDRLCVPAGGGLLVQVLSKCHDSPLGGHFGREKTAAVVQWVAFWPGLSDEVCEYVRLCGICHKVKANHEGPHGLLHQLQLPM